MASPLDNLPLAEAIDDVIGTIQALARHPDLSKLDVKAVQGSIGRFRFLKNKHAVDGRMLATPAGDREDASCRGN
ncbi:hypothetical protein [Solidesulfovibrio sp.]